MKDRKLTLAQNSIYNTIGTVGYCFLQWVITLVVVRLSKDMQNAGMLQLAMSVTNIFFSISIYNMRTFQISDIRNEYSSGDYIGTRIITSALAFILCIVYGLFWQYSLKNLLCIAAYMIYKLSEAFSDVFHGIIQKNFRMDSICFSHLLRGVIMVVVFVIAILITDDVFIAVTAMAFSTLLVVIIYDVSAARYFDSVVPIFDFKKILRLLLTCFPAVIASTAHNAIVTLPRQFLENSYGEEVLGYYATVATPLLVVQVVVLSIFNPLFSEISVYYADQKYDDIKKIIGKMVLLILGIGAVAFIGCALAGKPLLVLVYGPSIADYAYLIYAIVGCTTLYALCGLCYNILIIFRRLKTYMLAGILGLAASTLSSTFMIDKFYMNGVSYCVILGYTVFAVFSLTIILNTLKKLKRGVAQNDI